LQAAATPESAGGHGRIALLDGLRGVCALLIMLFHFHLLGFDTHAYLAVDFFFLLSGFVVAGAYEQRLKKGAGVGWFFAVRMARLYPLYLFGLVLGALVALTFQPATAVGVAFARGLVFLPQPLPGNPSFYALNGVYWSLGAELAINLAYGAGGFRLSSKALAALCLACGVGLFAIGALNGNCNPGAYTTWLDLTCAGLRVGFAFPVGVLAYRWSGALRPWFAPVSPFILVAAMTVLLMSPIKMPLYDPLAMTTALPVLFAALLAAPAVRGRMASLCDLLGRLSYPVYVTHFPLSDAYFHHWAPEAGRDLGAAAFPLCVGVLGTAVFALAWLAHKTLEPFGKQLISRLLARREAGQKVGRGLANASLIPPQPRL
jgi:peptidoglycan/LPS O-acetylase OafA/YrhL